MSGAINWKTTIPRDPSWARTYSEYQLTKRVFRKWRRFKEHQLEEQAQPLKKGMAVFALFKWIAVTLRQDTDREIYVFPFHAIQDYNREHHGAEIDSDYFISRIRRYAAEQMLLPSRRIPLFIHNVAVLDACTIRHSFQLWKKLYRKNKQLDDYFIVNYCRRLFRIWFAKARAQRKRNRSAKRVALKHEILLLRNVFTQWLRGFHLSRLYHTHWIPRRISVGFVEFCDQINRIKLRRCQIHLAVCHHVTSRLSHHWQYWRRRRCLLSNATLLTQSAVCRDLLVQHIKQQALGFNALVSRSASAQQQRQPFFRHLLQSWSSHSDQDAGRLSRQGRLDIVEMLQGELSSRISQLALELMAWQYYNVRRKQVALRLWLTRHLQAAMDSNPLDDSLVPRRSYSSFNTPYSRRSYRNGDTASYLYPSDESRAIGFSPVSLVTSWAGTEEGQASQLRLQRYVACNNYQLTKQLVYVLRRWRGQSATRRGLRTAFSTVRLQSQLSTQRQAFTSWLIQAVRYRTYRQTAHQLFSRYLRKLTVVFFYQWRNQYERRLLIKSNQLQLLQQRQQEIRAFTELTSSKHSHHLKYAVLRAWFLFVRDRNRAKRILSIWSKHAHRHLSRAAWTQWKLITSLSTIVTCVTKLWRGYRERFRVNPRVYQYLRWYRWQCPVVLSFRKRWRKKRVLAVFRLYLHHLRHQQVKQSVDVALHRGFRCLFQWYRHGRLERQRASLARQAFWQQRYPQRLFWRWRRCVWEHKKRRTRALQPYRLKIQHVLRRLLHEVLRQRRKRLATLWLRVKHFRSWRARWSLLCERRRWQRYHDLLAWRHVLSPFFGLWWHRTRQSLRVQTCRLQQRSRRVHRALITWRQHSQHRASSRRLAELFHAKMALYRYWTALRRYGREDVYHHVLRRQQRHERDRYYGYQPPLHAQVVHQGRQRLLLNPYRVPYLLQGRVSQYLRTAWKTLCGRLQAQRRRARREDSLLRQRSRQRLRRGYQAFQRLLLLAQRHPRYRHRHLFPRKTATSLARPYPGSSIEPHRLRRLWLDDRLPRSHLLHYMFRWMCLQRQQAQRRRYGRKQLGWYRRQQLGVWFQRLRRRVHTRRRRRKGQLRLESMRQMRQCRLALLTWREKTRRRRQQHRRVQHWRGQRQRQACRVFLFRLACLLTGYAPRVRRLMPTLSVGKTSATTAVGGGMGTALAVFARPLRSMRRRAPQALALRYIRKLCVFAQTFLSRLRQRVYRRRYSRPHRLVQQRFAHRLHLRVIAWQRHSRRYRTQRRQLQHIMHRYRLACQKEGMIHWRCIALYAKRMKQLARRFLLVPQWRRWRLVFAEQHEESRLFARFLPLWQLQRKKRIWTLWRIYVLRQARWALQYKVVRKQVVARQRRQALAAWMNVMDSQKLAEKYMAVRNRCRGHCLRRAWEAWYRLALKFELINYKNMKAVLVNWRYNVENYRRQMQAMRTAQLFHWNRLGYRAVQKWRLRVQWRRYWRSQEVQSTRRFHRKCYLAFFRKWKRQMYIRYFHPRPVRRGLGPGPRLGQGPGQGQGVVTGRSQHGETRHVRMKGAAHRYHLDSEEGEDEEVGGRRGMRERWREREASPMRETRTERGRGGSLDTSVFGTGSQSRAARTHRPGLSLHHLTASLPPPSSPPPRLSPPSRSLSPPRSSPRSLTYRAALPGLPPRRSLLPARPYRRLLNYDRDERLWPPYRLFVHWRRLTAQRVHRRRALLVKRLFFLWKCLTHNLKFLRQAFCARLQSLRRRNLALLLWQPLRENYKLAVNRKFLEYCRRKRYLQTCLHVWWRLHANRVAVRDKVRDVIRQIYARQRLRCWQTWKVKARPAVRLQRMWLMKKAYGYWRKLFISQLYARMVTAQRVFLTWKWKIQVDKMVYHVWRLRREKLASILHRYHTQCHLQAKLAFNVWKYKPQQDRTLRQYLQAIHQHSTHHRRGASSASALVTARGELPPPASEQGTRDMYQAMADLDRPLEQTYHDRKWKEELVSSQAGRFLLFSEEDVAAGVREGIAGVKLPRYHCIAHALLSKCAAAVTVRQKRKKPSDYPIVRSLREAMYAVVEQRASTTQQLYSPDSSLASPKKFIGVSWKGGDSHRPEVVAESKSEFVYTPVRASPSRPLPPPPPPPSSTIAPFSPKGSEMRLRDIL